MGKAGCGLGRWLGASAAAIAAAIGPSSAALAQDTAQDAATQDLVIVVTVQKREQAAIDVPINVTAYDGAALERLNVQEFDRLSLFVPGFEVQNQSVNNPGFVIRGITSDDGAATIEPRVSVYQDGVSIARARGSYVELFDIQQVEIAKGPQSTLFGRGALIGAVNVIQNKADPRALSGRLRGGVGAEGLQELEGMVNVPLDDRSALRLAARHKTRNGVVANLLPGQGDLGGVDMFALRASAMLTPTPTSRVDVIVNYQKDTPPGTAFKSGTYAPPGGDLSPYTPAALGVFGAFLDGEALGLDREVTGATVLGSVDLSERLSLSSISAYRVFNSLEVFDPDGFQLPVAVFAEDARSEQWSQELRLNFEGDRVDWFAGLSLFKEDGFQRVPLQFDERALQALVLNQLTRPIPQALSALSPINLPIFLGAQPPFPAGVQVLLKPIHTEEFTNFGSIESLDLFADGSFALTDRLQVGAGLRYTNDDKTSGIFARFLNGAARFPLNAAGGVFIAPTPGDQPLFRSDSFQGWTWRMFARFEASDSTNVYAAYARGRRPEVINATAPATFRVLPAEEVDSLELGAKTLLLDGELSLEGSVFTYQYTNFQTTEFSGAQLITVNAGEASATGFEGQTTWRAAEPLTLFATYGYNHARFDRGAREGNSFRLSPDHTLSLGAQWRFGLGGWGDVTIAPVYAWQSEMFFDDDNDRPDLQRRSPASLSDRAIDETQAAYGLLDLTVTLTPRNARWSVELWGTNLADEDYLLDAGNTGDIFGAPTFIRGAPRLYGVRFGASF